MGDLLKLHATATTVKTSLYGVAEVSAFGEEQEYSTAALRDGAEAAAKEAHMATQTAMQGAMATQPTAPQGTTAAQRKQPTAMEPQSNHRRDLNLSRTRKQTQGRAKGSRPRTITF